MLNQPSVTFEGTELALRRVLGRYSTDVPGPLLVVTAGIHGNEPAGLLAFARVLARLHSMRVSMRGSLVGLGGNLAALSRDVRYIDEDLNRLWSYAPRSAAAPIEASAPSIERREQQELDLELTALIDAHSTSGHSITLLDLHSTSSEGPPFTILEGGPRNVAIARALGVPSILDLHKDVPGTLLDFVDHRSIPGIVLEGGQNRSPHTAAHHEAGIWILLEHLGMLPSLEPSFLAAERQVLQRAALGLPGLLRIFLRWNIESGEEFEMLPGFRGFQRVPRGEVLATSRRPGAHRALEVRCPQDAVLVMPRYQGQGSDGFFLAQEL